MGAPETLESVRATGSTNGCRTPPATGRAVGDWIFTRYGNKKPCARGASAALPDLRKILSGRQAAPTRAWDGTGSSGLRRTFGKFFEVSMSSHATPVPMTSTRFAARCPALAEVPATSRSARVP